MVSPGAMLQRVSAVLTCRSSTSYTHKLRDAPPSDDRRPVTPPGHVLISLRSPCGQASHTVAGPSHIPLPVTAEGLPSPPVSLRLAWPAPRGTEGDSPA